MERRRSLTIRRVTMMASITLYLKRQRLNWLLWLLAAVLLGVAAGPTRAQSMPQEPPALKLERIDDGLWLSTQLAFELPSVVEDALLKGIPIYFVAEVDVLRERWYWVNRKLSNVKRQLRLAYHPLTRRWRLNVTAGEISPLAQGLVLGQNFDSLQDAMAAVRRIGHWRIADAAEVEAGAKHVVEFRFRLDVAQLPRPLQIGTLGQSDWQIAITASQVLSAESGK